MVRSPADNTTYLHYNFVVVKPLVKELKQLLHKLENSSIFFLEYNTKTTVSIYQNHYKAVGKVVLRTMKKIDYYGFNKFIHKESSLETD